MSTLLTTLVLMPLPLPSIWEWGEFFFGKDEKNGASAAVGRAGRWASEESAPPPLFFLCLLPPSLAPTHLGLQAGHLVPVKCVRGRAEGGVRRGRAWCRPIDARGVSSGGMERPEKRRRKNRRWARARLSPCLAPTPRPPSLVHAPVKHVARILGPDVDGRHGGGCRRWRGEVKVKQKKESAGERADAASRMCRRGDGWDGVHAEERSRRYHATGRPGRGGAGGGRGGGGGGGSRRAAARVGCGVRGLGRRGAAGAARTRRGGRGHEGGPVHAQREREARMRGVRGGGGVGGRDGETREWRRKRADEKTRPLSIRFFFIAPAPSSPRPCPCPPPAAAGDRPVGAPAWPPPPAAWYGRPKWISSACEERGGKERERRAARLPPSFFQPGPLFFSHTPPPPVPRPPSPPLPFTPGTPPGLPSNC